MPSADFSSGTRTLMVYKNSFLLVQVFLEIRNKYFEERSLYSLFQNVIPEVIFDFLREIGVFFTKYEMC